VSTTIKPVTVLNAMLGNGAPATPHGLSIRDLERVLDAGLRTHPPKTGRIWQEHRPGFRGNCRACGRQSRTWVGRYVLHETRACIRFTIHRSDPLCVICAGGLQMRERHLPHERDA